MLQWDHVYGSVCKLENQQFFLLGMVQYKHLSKSKLKFAQEGVSKEPLLSRLRFPGAAFDPSSGHSQRQKMCNGDLWALALNILVSIPLLM